MDQYLGSRHDLVAAMAEAGRFKEAKQVARAIADDFSRAEAWAKVAQALARAGQMTDAAGVAADSEELALTSRSHSRDAVLVDLVGVMIEAGRFKKAERIARSVAANYARAGALFKVAQALDEAGQSEDAAGLAAGAEELAFSIVDDSPKHQAAQTLAEVGQTADARRIAETITDDFLRAQALIKVAQAFAKAGGIADAESIYVDLLSGPTWPMAVGPLIAISERELPEGSWIERFSELYFEKIGKSTFYRDSHPWE